MKPVNIGILLVSGSLLVPTLVVAEKQEAQAGQNGDETSMSLFEQLGIIERAQRTRLIERPELPVADEQVALDQEDVPADFLERAYKTRAVERDHIISEPDSLVFCLPAEEEQQLTVRELEALQSERC